MDLSFRSAQRCLQEWAPGTPLLPADDAALEVAPGAQEPPRLVDAPLIEGDLLRARAVPGEPEAGFAAFLDGIQRSRVLGYQAGLPVVFGVVAAVARARIDRRLRTWRGAPLVSRKVYIPAAYTPPALAGYFERDGLEVVDTTAVDDGTAPPIRHPFTLLDVAVHRVQEERERLEQLLAEQWCESERSPLFMDGGLSRSDGVARAECAVGVVKSHRTLYVEGEALERVFALRRGERSSVFRLSSSWRAPVASWYLRLRDPAGRGPLWGLVRVEVADPAALGEDAGALTRRADRISRWILAEVSPIALPDGRWDRMVYGIRDCEEYLKASV